jgi:hypothetical protein
VKAGRAPWRAFPIALLILGAAFAAFSPAARGLDCPQPQVTTNGQVLWEGEILTVLMDSGDSAVVGFLVVAEVVGGPAFFDESYHTVPAAAGIDLEGLGGTNVRVTVTSNCSGTPWNSDPVVRDVAVRAEWPPPPTPPTPDPTDEGAVGVILLLAAAYGGIALAFVLVARHVRSRNATSVRCPRCRTRYRAGSILCPRDGTALSAPPPPPPPSPPPPGWR